jgi:hypothetical protein
MVARAYRAKMVTVSMLIVISIAGILLPFTSVVKDYRFGIQGVATELTLYSIEYRFRKTWPDALELITEKGAPLTGRGIGGIGTAQKLYESEEHNPADNMYVYLYAILGAGMFVVVCFLVFMSVLLKPSQPGMDRFSYFIVVILMAGGITSNMLESPFAAISFGLLLSHMLSTRTAPVDVDRLKYSGVN